MKKLLMLVSALVLALTLVACNVGDDPLECPDGQFEENGVCVDEPVECTDTQTEVDGVCVENSVIDTETLQAIVDGFSLNVTLTEVVADLTLPLADGEAVIAWASSNEDVVSSEGVVTQQLAGDEAVTLTATFTYNGIELTKTFDVTVLKLQAEPFITIPEDGIVTMVKGDSDSLALAVGTDDNDGDISSSIEVTGDFNVDLAGYYDVVLSLTDSDGSTVTKDATLKVVYAEPVIITGETWGVEETEVKNLVVFDVIENFTEGQVFNIAIYDGVLTGPTIFHNTTDAAVTISVANAYGVGAILDANGVVLEGRDGANGRLVDDSCGLRVLCAQGSLDANDPLANLTIPAGGYAIVAVNQNTDYNEDGRKFVNEQIINRIDKVVEMKFDGELLFTYADQAPFFTIDGKVKPSGSFTLTATKGTPVDVLDGIVIYDDEGTLGSYAELVKSDTFDPVVSVTLWDELGTEYTVADYTSYSFEYAGVYDVEIVITDGTNERLYETQITVFLFEELSAPAFRITGDDFVYIDLMAVPYTYNYVDTDENVDTASYHLYDDYTALVNATTSAPLLMGWGSFIIFDVESGNIEVNYNIFSGNVFVADGVTYIDTTLFADANGLGGITALPEGKVLLVGPQGTELRGFALGNTSRDLTGTKIEFINVPEVPSIVPTYETSTLVFNYNGEVHTVEITGYGFNKEIAGTDNMPTGQVLLVDDYNAILGLDGTPLNMGWGSYMVIDKLTKEIEVYANWANVFTVDGVDYVDGTTLAAATVLDTLTSLPEGKLLIVSPQGTQLRDDLHNVLGSNSDITSTTLGMFEIYETPTLVLEANGEKYIIELGEYYVDWAYSGTDNMPTGAVDFHTDYNNILGLDGTPLNMGWGSYMVIDTATGEVEVYANWGEVYLADGVTYADGTNLSGANVLDTLTDLPAGKTLIISPQGTQLRDDLYNVVGNLTDITGGTVKLYLGE